MIRFEFVDSPAGLFEATEELMVVAKKRVLEPKLPRGLAPIADPLRALAEETKAQDLGGVGSTLVPGPKPKRLWLGLVPDEPSRYNAPCFPEAIQKVLGGGFGKKNPSGLVLILERKADVIPALNAVGRAFPRFERRSAPSEDGVLKIAVLSARGDTVPVGPITEDTIETARTVAALVDTPPSELTPAALVERAHELLADRKYLRTEEIVGDALLDKKLGGIHAVGRAAHVPPRMLVVSYRPPKAKPGHIALVGKGITFDTGGLHLKQRGFMEGMKSDMGGAGAVLGAFRVLVGERIPRRITLVLCLAENAIGPLSYKPDDILTLHSGKTVEINNTDAEGRLLLADGVSYAARELGADTILDAATLTGAQLFATGWQHAAVFSNDAELERTLVEAGTASGDLTHPIPFGAEFFMAEFKSPIADLRNSVKNRTSAQTSAAGQFIYTQIEDTGARYGHIDLAGPAFRNERGTGYGVALLAETLRRLR